MSTPASLVARATDAVRRLVACRETVDRPDARFVDRWWSCDEVAARQAIRQGGSLTFRERRWLCFLMADKKALSFEESSDRRVMRSALIWLAQGYHLVAKDGRLALEARRTGAAAILEVGRRGRLPQFLRDDAVKVLGDEPLDDAFWAATLGVSKDELQVQLKEVTLAITASEDLPAGDPSVGRRELSAAEALAEIASSPPPETHDPLVYDSSDAKVRVARFSCEAFRGSPAELALDFTKQGAALSTLIFGDNGSGKSTIVDAIEFGLQGRVGRSTSYDSPLGPSLRSFARGADTAPRVRVELSDGSVIERSLERRPDGRWYQAGDSVRPGFRIAPVTLKRQDILRFLDTDGLSRGQIFFDYFPTSAEQMAVRPEEMSQRLDEESYELRIRRKALAERLARVLELDQPPLSREDLTAALKAKVTNGKSPGVFDWTQADEGTALPAQQLIAVMGRLSAIKKEKERGLQVLNPKQHERQAEILARELAPLGEELTNAFKAVTRIDYVDRIEVLFGKSGPIALDVLVHLTNGTSCFPQQLFSEGYRDLVALLFFTSVAKRAAGQGQAKVLILDDVFQSVDAGVRAGVMTYLLESFADWQIILTIHDRLWLENVRALFRSRSHAFAEMHLRTWRYETGPQLAGLSGEFPGDRVKRAIGNDDPVTICGIAGRSLEELCDNLSWRLHTSVERKAEDKYTLGDLWPGVRKALRKTVADGPADQINDSMYLRNIAGAHYNDWASVLSLAEATEFAEAVVQLIDRTFCPNCGSWIVLAKSPGTKASCTCGAKKL